MLQPSMMALTMGDFTYMQVYQYTATCTNYTVTCVASDMSWDQARKTVFELTDIPNFVHIKIILQRLRYNIPSSLVARHHGFFSKKAGKPGDEAV